MVELDNETVMEILDSVLPKLREYTKEILSHQYGEDWWSSGVLEEYQLDSRFANDRENEELLDFVTCIRIIRARVSRNAVQSPQSSPDLLRFDYDTLLRIEEAYEDLPSDNNRGYFFNSETLISPLREFLGRLSTDLLHALDDEIELYSKYGSCMIKSEPRRSGELKHVAKPALTPRFVERGTIRYALERDVLTIDGEGTIRKVPMDFKNLVHEVVIRPEIHTIGGAAFAGWPIRSVILPNSIMIIRPHAFENCKQLEEVKGIENVKNIGDYAFNRTPFKMNGTFNELTLGMYDDLEEMTKWL